MNLTQDTKITILYATVGAMAGIATALLRRQSRINQTVLTAIIDLTDSINNNTKPAKS